ncbi:MAG: B12-binding domain-containing radical SAM protein [Acidobacteria bacterium]|nr:MAG: B12-binding domain-containing radical SAM protein [Acidobacteriota bacterium]
MLKLTEFRQPPGSESAVDPDTLPAFRPLGPAPKVLLVWPRFPASFWSFEGILDLVPMETEQPPLGLLTVAALCPKNWALRLIDRSFEDLLDEDLLWADLVMLSGMRVQKDDIREILLRGRALGRRTIIGGPFASSEPELLLRWADHVVVGEPDEVFPEIASDLEHGSAKRLYVVKEKPDVSKTPLPRFDLLKIDKYASMAIQFSRGCPFQCEFCDIITIYGRKPRAKSPAQVLAELDALLELGWRDQVFIVDDNFIGNHKLAHELALELQEWQKRRGYPLLFYTEASIDLAQKPDLIDAMVKANFFYVFIGIESPSPKALKEARKFQNLRRDPLECVHSIQSQGLWVTAGFIIGFDSDTEEIFEQQRDFIEQAAIPWAMAGFLIAPPTTALYDRMLKEGRLLTDTTATSNFDPPNFKTRLPLPVLLRGMHKTLTSLYAPSAFYDRCYRSLVQWKAREPQKAPDISPWAMLVIFVRSIVRQGLLSNYRGAYWKFLFRSLRHWLLDPRKLSMGLAMLLSGHHFIPYARQVAAQLEMELSKPIVEQGTPELHEEIAAC